MKREDTDTERGLVLLSFGINFVDWLRDNDKYIPFDEKRRGNLVIEFMKSHSGKKNVFKQAEEIAARLGVPLGRPNNPDESLKRVATKILQWGGHDLNSPTTGKDIEAITKILNEEWDA